MEKTSIEEQKQLKFKTQDAKDDNLYNTLNFIQIFWIKVFYIQIEFIKEKSMWPGRQL